MNNKSLFYIVLATASLCLSTQSRCMEKQITVVAPNPQSLVAKSVAFAQQPIGIQQLQPQNIQQIQQQQQNTKAPLAVLAYGQDDTTLLDQGVLGLVNNEILQTTGSIQLKANFANKSRRLWPGQLVNARLLVDTRHNGLTVAASAVQQGPNGAYVYVIDPDNTVQNRPVKVAQISAGQALIDSGLKANEQVVVDGQYKLQPGTHVSMLHGQAAQEAIAQSALQAPIP